MSHASRVSSGGGVSRLASSCPKDFEFEFFVYQNEVNYNVWWNAKGLLLWVRGLGDNSVWNCFIGCIALVGLIQVAAELIIHDSLCLAIDVVYNIIYLGHVLFMFFERVRQAMYENTDFTSCMKYGFVADIISYIHYITLILPAPSRRPVKLVCYYIRLHTPFEYLWALTSSNLNGSVLGTAFKYFYISLVMRVSFAFLWVKGQQVRRFINSVANLLKGVVPNAMRQNYTRNSTKDKEFVARHLPGLRNIWSTAIPNAVAFVNTTVKSTALVISDLAMNSTYLETTTTNSSLASSMTTNNTLSQVKLVNAYSRAIGKDLTVRGDTETGKFIRAFHIINPMFMPLGPVVNPINGYERVVCFIIIIIGSLLVSGAAVASLALIISLYMRPAEVFRARFRLIMDEMANTHVSAEMRERVRTFYNIYWQKQKAITLTQLLAVFPPTLSSAIYTDIYFEAQQRSQILCDLSYPFLWELAKNMVTIHYIPGDAIIKRKSDKASIIYIAYGDVEMLTAEDDDTPILRMTRGTMISPCGGCAPMACGKALVEIRAATYCTAHVLTAANLWRVALKHGKTNGQAFIILSAFDEHFERVKRHYKGRFSPNVKFKSSILQFKQNLKALKEAKDENGKILMTRSDYFLEIAGTYIMRNKADATTVDEADEICLRSTFPCILQPNSSLIIFWDVLMTMLIVVVIIIHPYYIFFSVHKPITFKFFDIIASMFFILDMTVHLSTGANVEEGLAVTFAQTCTHQVQNYWFFLDVLSTLPIFEFVREGEWAGINKLLRMPKVFRVLKTLEDMIGYYGYILRFFSYTLFMGFLSYIFAFVQQAYMCHNFGRCIVSNYTRAPFWYDVIPFSPSTVARTRLVAALYYAVSMLTCTAYKMGTWELFHWHNVLYVTISLEVATIVTILVAAMYSATIMVTSSFREDYISTINDVKTFLVRNNVDSLLQKRFITYLSLCWHTDKAFSMTQKKSIFYDLPPHVYQDIVAKQRIKHILCVPFMKFLRPEDLKLVSAKTRIFYTSPNEILQNTGDIVNEIFIIKQGICQLHDPDTKTPIRRISIKESFGVLECLLRFPAFYTVSAVTHVQLLAVPNKYLQNALRVPRLMDAFDYAKEQPEYARSQLRREPFINYENPPPTKSLYHFPLLRKFEPDTAFMQPFTRLGFFSILRYVFPRYTIRPDGKYIYRYEWFRAICALTSSIIYPSYTYMVLQVPELYYITWTLDIMAYLDMVQRLLVGYYNEEGILVSHPASTAAHYLKGAFLVDFFACVPLEKLETDNSATTEQVLLAVNNIQQLLMFNRIIQLYRLPGAMDVISKFIEREDILLMIKAIPFLFAMINILVTFIVQMSVTFHTDVNQANWTISDLENWLILYKDVYRFNLTGSPWNVQLTVFSWVVYEVTTTGYNLFQPNRRKIIMTFITGMLLGGMMTTYFAVRVISIRANVNKMLANFQEHMKDIARYMEKEKLRANLQKDVIAYYEYNWEKTGGTDYRNVLKLCDQITLRTDAILHLYGHTFAKCPILYHSDLSLLRVVGRAVRSQYFLNDTTIISKGDLVFDMYFVDYGTVDVRESKEILRTEARLPRGSVFGNLEQLTAIRSPTDIVATAHCHLLQMNTSMFYDIILDFPAVKVLLTKYRPKKENYIIGGLAEGSSLMNQWKEHISTSSPTIVVSRKGVSNYFNINSRACQTYLVIVSLAVIYLDIYNAGFQSNSMIMIMFLYFFDIAFVLKIPLSYIQPYVVVKGEQRIALAENRKIYFKSEFYYDLLSCLPFEVFSLIASKSDKWSIFSILRLNRLLRFMTIQSCLKRHQAKLNINLVFSTIVAVFIWFSLFVHITACLWYTVGVYEDKKKPRSSWMYKDNGSPNYVNKYVCSLYIILTTFTHKGVADITAKNQSEVIFMIILQIISTMMFMIYVGEFSNIIQYQSFRSFGYYSKFLELQDFLSNNRVSKNLVKMVSRYSLHLWRESRGVQMPYFLETAPPCFKLKVMSAAYMHHLIINPSFKDCEPAFLRQLVGCLTLFRYNTALFVVREGEITDSMYLVHNGRVVEIDEDMDEEINEFLPGTYFGQVQGLIRDTPYNYSYKTTSKAEVLTLSLDKWEHLLEYFPLSRYSIFKNYPNHPYSRHPDNEPKKPKDLPEVEKKRQMMARRKTEHELKAKPLGNRDLSPSESENYKPFYMPPAMTATGKTPGSVDQKTLGGESTNRIIASKVPAAEPAAEMSTAKLAITKEPATAKPAAEILTAKVGTTKVPDTAEPAAKMSTAKSATTKVPATAESVDKLSSAKSTTTKLPADSGPTAKVSTAKVSATKESDTTTKMPAAALAAIAGGAVVTGTIVAGATALAATSAPKSVSESTPAKLSNSSAMAPLSASFTNKVTASSISDSTASKSAITDGTNKISEQKIEGLKDALASTLGIPENSVDKRMMPRPTAAIGKLQEELQEVEKEEANTSSPRTKRPLASTTQIYGENYNYLTDERRSVSYITTKSEPNLPPDEKEELLPARGKTRTELLDTIILSPSTSESKSVAIPILEEGKIKALKNADISEIKTSADTGIWPMGNKPELQAFKEKSVQEESSPVLKAASPPKPLPMRSDSESLLKHDLSLPYFEYDSDDDNETKKEEKKISEEYEEPPKSFMRRVTQHAKKFIGGPSISAMKDRNETNASALEEDIKATSALLQKYEERSKMSRIPQENDEKKSLLAQYIEKRDADLATSQKEESEEKFVREAPRRSIVVFGNDEAPAVRNIPIEQPDDNDEAAKILRTPRRSVVIFDSEGKSSLGVSPQEETIYDSDKTNNNEIPSVDEESNKKESENNATTAQLTSINPIDRSFEESSPYKKDEDNTEIINLKENDHFELPLTTTEESKNEKNDVKHVLEDIKPPDDEIGMKNVADYDINATEIASAPQSSAVVQPSTVPSSSSLKKRLVKTSLLASLFRKNKPSAENTPEDKVQTRLTTAEVSETSDENEDYESKLADDDGLHSEKRTTHVRYVGDKVVDDEFLLFDDDDFEEGPSKQLPPEQTLIDDNIQIKDMTEDEKKFMMMDSDVDPSLRRRDDDEKKKTD